MQRLITCLSALALLGLLAACEITIDERTGESDLRVKLPGSEAQRASLERQWRRCITYSSRSVCERRIGWVPPGQ